MGWGWVLTIERGPLSSSSQEKQSSGLGGALETVIRLSYSLGVVTQAFNPNMLELEAGGSSGIPDQLGLPGVSKDFMC